MRLMVVICMAVVAFYIGEWTSDNGLAIGFFIGSVIMIIILWDDDPPEFNHIILDDEERLIKVHSTRQTSDSGLFKTVLCVIGVAWLLGDDE